MSLTCSAASGLAGEALAATAPQARGWIIVEVPGPWGRQALRECRLPDGIGDELADRAAGSGTTVLVARRPGRADDDAPAARRVWVAHTSPGGVRMRVLTVSDPRQLLALDPAGIARGESPGTGERSVTPALFVCANGKRDQCCATAGGSLARALSESVRRDQVWECSHIGGHRFAATALLLPWGTVHGRLDLASALDVLHDADRGELSPTTYRGRSALPRWMQAAEMAVRTGEDIRGIDDLHVLRVIDGVALPDAVGPIGEAPGNAVDAEVRHVDGRAWRVTSEAVPWEAARAESCTGEPVEGVSWMGTLIARAPTWH